MEGVVRLRYRLMQLLRRHWMLGTAAFVALVSMFLVPPDGAYLGYFDWKTIGCLFCVLAVASALRNAGVFDWAARAAIALRKPAHAHDDARARHGRVFDGVYQ